MDLYQFGFGAQTQPIARSRGTTNLTPVLYAQTIQVLWVSWCDALIAHQDAQGSWTLEYTGTGLRSSQSEYITRSEDLIHAVSINTNSVRFVGGAMHHGLQGYIISNNGSQAIADSVVLFATDQEMEAGTPEVQCHTLNSRYGLFGIQIGSGGAVLVSMRDKLTGEEQISRFQDLQEFRRCLSSGNALCLIYEPLTTPVQWRTNATTSTALDQHGTVCTATSDPRYSRCLGRPYEGSPAFGLVPYLSETHIVNIASGGYMSAAVSLDGELFLWGQACSAATKELRVLKERTTLERNGHELAVTGVWIEGEQDELVKCLTVRIDGEEARVYAVAIGHGHIIVAAEVSGSLGASKKAVFVAGDNGRQQLGTNMQREYLEEFTEVAAFRGKRVEQLAAAGWSSFVVVST